MASGFTMDATADLSRLDDLNIDNVLTILKQRYEQDLIYVSRENVLHFDTFQTVWYLYKVYKHAYIKTLFFLFRLQRMFFWHKPSFAFKLKHSNFALDFI